MSGRPDRKRARRAGRIAAKKAERRARKDARRSDPSRNLDKDRGAEVTVDDVKKHAQPGHPPCRGSGMVNSLQRGRREPCRCAARRFLELHPEIIMDATGRAWWPQVLEPM